MKPGRFKKLALFLIGAWIVIIIIGLVFSHSAQKKLIDILSEQAGKYINTEIRILKKDIHFSIFKKFPDASIELRNVCVMVPRQVDLAQSFAPKGDTLLFAEKLYLQLNLRDLFNKKYSLQKISIQNGFLQAITDSKGNSSLNILKVQEKKKQDNFHAQIQSLNLSNTQIFICDFSNNSLTKILIKKGIASGEFSKNDFSVNVKTNGKLESVATRNQKLLPDQNFEADIELGFADNSYNITRGEFSFGNIPFKVIGSIRAEQNVLVNLLFSSKDVPLKSIDKTILNGIIGENGLTPKSGLIDIQATFIGYTKYSLPAIKANFKINGARIYDKKHDVTYSDIFLIGNADNGQEHTPASTTIRIDTINFSVNNSKQWGKFKIGNLIDPEIAVSLKGTLDFNDLSVFVKIPDVSFKNGLLENDLSLYARINKKDAQKVFEDVTVWGTVKIHETIISLNKYAIPEIFVDGNVMLAKDKTLTFENLYCKSADTDLKIDGQLMNFMDDNNFPVFRGNIKANHFNAENFISVNQNAKSNANTVNFPDSLIISANLSVTTFEFGKFTSQSFSGNINYANKILQIPQFNMDGFDGSSEGKMTIDQQSNGDITLFVDANLKGVNITKLFEGCNNFSQKVITSEYLSGLVSGHIIFSSQWNNTFKLKPEMINSQSHLIIKNGRLSNYEPLNGLSNFVDIEELKDVRFNNLETDITISKEQVYLDQTHIGSSALVFEGSGVHGFDNKYEYRLQLGLSDLLYKKAKNKQKEVTEFGYIEDDGVGHTIIPVIISGKGTSFDVKFDKKTARTQFKNKLEKEKKDLKELFTEEQSQKNERSVIQSENTNDNSDKMPKLVKTDSGKYQSRSDEFILEWDDTEANPDK